MDNGYNIIPEHIRENLKYFSPGITEHNHLCLECGYCGLMGFTTSSNWDLKACFNKFFWFGASLLAFIIVMTGGGLIEIIMFLFAIYMLNSATGGNITETYHCPNCGATYKVKQEDQHEYII